VDAAPAVKNPVPTITQKKESSLARILRMETKNLVPTKMTINPVQRKKFIKIQIKSSQTFCFKTEKRKAPQIGVLFFCFAYSSYYVHLRGAM